MRTKKVYPQTIKRIYRPEITHCLSCLTRLQRCLTISQRTVVTLQQVVRGHSLWLPLSQKHLP